MSGKRKRTQSKPSKQAPSDLDRLVRIITTTLRREGKVVKAHEILKVVKRLKQQRLQHEKLAETAEGKQHAEDATERNPEVDFDKLLHKSKKKVDSLERKLEHVKQFDMDVLLRICLRRLGLALLGVDIEAAVQSLTQQKEKGSRSNHLGEQQGAVGGAEENEGNSAGEQRNDEGTQQTGKSSDEDNSAGEQRNDEGTQQNDKSSNDPGGNNNNADSDEQLVETLLLHKKLAIAMDTLNKRVTEYRRDLLRAQGEEIPGDGAYRRHKKQEREASGIQWSRRQKQRPGTGGHDGPGSMFIDSLSGEVDHEDMQDEGNDGPNYNHYGPGSDDPFLNQKKNRRGQRARRAKAMAQEAATEGRRWDSSVNWRPKKKKIDKDSVDPGSTAKEQKTVSGLASNKEIKAAHVADMGRDWKEEGKAHPSWAAKQHAKQQSGIASFSGKKITFDN